jgi:topoisomerase-4 subunit B
MGADIRLLEVQIQSMGGVHKTLEFLMGKNTPERRKFIVNNLVADVLQGA